LDESLASLPSEYRPEFLGVDPADAPDVVATHVAEAVRRAIAQTDDARRVALTNDLLSMLAAPEEQLPGAIEHLIALTRQLAPGRPTIPRPVTPLSQAALLTNSRDEPSLSAELRAELSSADQVDLLCAFIRWHGLRVLEEPLAELRHRGVPFRVLTTTYLGATERRAVDELVRRFGAEVRIS
jgi:hypothetical protein